MALAYG